MNYIHQINAFWEKFDNTDNARGYHGMVYFALLFHNNECGWKRKFNVSLGQMINKAKVDRETYYKALDFLNNNGFFDYYEKAKNQYSMATFSLKVLYDISASTPTDTTTSTPTDIGADQLNNPKLINNKLKTNKQLDIDQFDFSKANFDNLKAATNDLHDTTGQARTIPITQPEKYSFEEFWNLYNKKVGKQKAEKLYSKTTLAERERIMTIHLPYYLKQQPDSKFRKNPEGYLNQKLFNDEVIQETAAPADEPIWVRKYPNGEGAPKTRPIPEPDLSKPFTFKFGFPDALKKQA